MDLKSRILTYLDDSASRVTPRDLEKKMAKEQAIPRQQLRGFIHRLLSEGLITYTYDFGRTFIEISYNQPVRIARSIVLKPPRITYASSQPEDIVIELAHGVSFGTGRHPTTRLALSGMEYILRRMDFFDDSHKSAALDIGTGSGVLAIAAVQWGFKTADATEIDACACNEARKNVRLNGLGDRITVHHLDQPSLKTGYGLITANLRTPTLKGLYPLVYRLSDVNSAIVLSGIMETEMSGIVDTYTQHDFKCIWQSTQQEWAALAFIRNLKKLINFRH